MATAWAGREALDRALPNPDALSMAYRFQDAPIEVVRSQARGWQNVLHTELLGEQTERNLMQAYGFFCRNRNKWASLDVFAAMVGVSYYPQFLGLDGNRYSVTKQLYNPPASGWLGTWDTGENDWAGAKITRARHLELYVTVPPTLTTHIQDFVLYVVQSMIWLFPYFGSFITVYITVTSDIYEAIHVVTGQPIHLSWIYDGEFVQVN